MTTRILSVIGARPQFIKAATVSRAFAQQGIDEILLHTGQHYDKNMSDVFFTELDIPKPHYNLGVGSGFHGQQTGEMLAAIEQALLKEKPQAVLVYGDTNSTLAGALAAAKLHIPVAHVEAGLRSFNRRMPEEINRVMTDHVSSLLFAPTEVAVAHLKREGIAEAIIKQVGDVMYDAALYYGKKAEVGSSVLEALELEPKAYLLATVHRAENTDDPERLRAIFEALAEINQGVRVVLPLHPRTRKMLKEAGLEALSQSLHLVDPVGYLDMVRLEQNARAVITDSGGIQKEAFFHGVPCVTLRDETEWTETVELGANRLAVPLSRAVILEKLSKAFDTSVTEDAQPYGDGSSAQKIVTLLGDLLGE